MLPNCELKLSENQRVRRFVNHVRNELSQHGMKLVFGRGVQVNCEGMRLSGYFSELEGVIRVGRRNSYWLTILAHEYAHFLQWKNNSREYVDININNKDSIYIIEDWIGGTEYRPSTLRKAFVKARLLEKRCEMKALSLIRRFNLPVNEEYFVKQANCHIYYYHMMEKTRSRSGLDFLFANRRLNRVVPSTFQCKNVRHIPKRVYDVILTSR